MSHKLRNLLAVFVAALTALAVTPAFAQTVGTAKTTDNATITVNNAAKGETYTVYKLFDATYNTTTKTIAYTGTVPESLQAYFTADATTGAITVTDAGKDTDDSSALSTAAVAAIKAWAATQTKVTDAVSDGSALTFTGLDYGYYVVTSTQGNGAAIGVNSTKPGATINDKNSTTTIGDLTKTADDDNVKVGDTVTYTVSFTTANYDGTDQVTSYTIKDTLPTGLTLDDVSSITIGGSNYKVNNATPQFNDDGEITIPWVDSKGNSLYANGAKIVVTYTATVNAQVAIDGNGNTNSVTVTYKTKSGKTGTDTTSKTIYSYAFAIQKVDANGKGLAGAEFQLPFYVNATADNDGAYVYAGIKADEGLTNTVTTPDSGLIVVKGVEAIAYSITETKAPAGYNKLAGPVSVTPVKTGSSTTTKYYTIAEDGTVTEVSSSTDAKVTVSIADLSATPVVVVNQAGTELPSTGGMGTTIFTVVGSALVIAAACALVAKKRVEK